MAEGHPLAMWEFILGEEPCKSALLRTSPHTPVETAGPVKTHLKINSLQRIKVPRANLCSLRSLPVTSSPLLFPAAFPPPSKWHVAVFLCLNMLHTGEKGYLNFEIFGRFKLENILCLTHFQLHRDHGVPVDHPPFLSTINSQIKIGLFEGISWKRVVQHLQK